VSRTSAQRVAAVASASRSSAPSWASCSRDHDRDRRALALAPARRPSLRGAFISGLQVRRNTCVAHAATRVVRERGLTTTKVDEAFALASRRVAATMLARWPARALLVAAIAAATAFLGERALRARNSGASRRQAAMRLALALHSRSRLSSSPASAHASDGVSSFGHGSGSAAYAPAWPHHVRAASLARSRGSLRGLRHPLASDFIVGVSTCRRYLATTSRAARRGARAWSSESSTSRPLRVCRRARTNAIEAIGFARRASLQLVTEPYLEVRQGIAALVYHDAAGIAGGGLASLEIDVMPIAPL